MGIYILILQLKKLRLCNLPQVKSWQHYWESSPTMKLLSANWQGGQEQAGREPQVNTLYSPMVMRARSTSPPTELPTISGTGLCTSYGSTFVSVWGREREREVYQERQTGFLGLPQPGFVHTLNLITNPSLCPHLSPHSHPPPPLPPHLFQSFSFNRHLYNPSLPSSFQ